MGTIHLSATAGPDGVLHLDIPVGTAGEFDVTVAVRPKPGKPPAPEELGWPPGYFEGTAGAIPDFSVEPREVGVPEEREPL